MDIERSREGDLLIAQEQRVLVLPSARMEEMELGEEIIGPFEPMVPISVPLYLAVVLRNSLLCRILPPEWLSIKHLKGVIERELETEDEYQAIDLYIFDNANTYLENCEMDESAAEIRLLLEQLKEIRMGKTLKGLEVLDSRIIGITNLTFHEYRRIKEYFLPHIALGRVLDE